MTPNQWQPWFAWHPVYVDAYSVADMRRGKMRYLVWLRWVRRCLVTLESDEDEPWTGWRYRL